MRTNQQHSDNTRRPVRRRNLTLGVAMVVVGVLLLTIVSGYFAYAANARSQLDDLNYDVVAQSTIANPSAPTGALLAPPSTMSSAQLISNPAVAPAQGATTSASATTSSGSAAVNLSVNAGSQAGVVSPAQPANPTGQTSPASPANQEESLARHPSKL